MIVLGIDPGMYGGLAVVNPHGGGAVIDIPIIGVDAKARVNVLELAAWLRRQRPIHAYVERAQSFPGQGSSSGFKYGRAVGAIEATATVLGIPLTIVEASAWKGYYGLKGKKADPKAAQEAARQRALMLYPGAAAQLARKQDHGRAEALLIARYGIHLLGMKVPEQLLGAA